MKYQYLGVKDTTEQGGTTGQVFIPGVSFIM